MYYNMKKITKSLMVLGLLAMGVTSANAQDDNMKWTELPTTGWVHEWRYTGVDMEDADAVAAVTQTDGEALIDEETGAYKVYCRSEALATLAGNKTLDGNGNFADWDSQFFITFGQENTLKQGDKVRVSFSYMADTDVTVGTQSHGAPGGYIQWYCIGDVTFAADTWKDFNKTFTVGENNSPVDGTYTIAFNLAKGNEVNFFFKDIKIEFGVKKAPEASVTYGDLVKVTPVIYAKEDNGDIVVPEPDGDGVYSVTNTLTSGDDWRTQFWIAAPYALPSGQKFYVEFERKADVATSVATQTHAGPGGYLHYACIGDVSFAAPAPAEDPTLDKDATDGWELFTKEVTLDGNMNGWQSIAFNLNKNEENTYYFRNIKLKVPAKNEGVAVEVEKAGWKSFCYDKAVDLGNASGYAAKFNGEFVDLIAIESHQVPANTPILLKGTKGKVERYTFAVIESAEAITDNDLKVAVDGTTGDGASIFALKADDSEAGAGFYLVANAVEIPAGKVYLEVAAAEEARGYLPIGFGAAATGINAVAAAQNNNAIFNLAGQRVVKAQKGLYIMNGKKVLVK